MIKIVDSKGRVSLGRRFANKPIIIEDLSDTEVKISLARVIPEREMWLWHNPEHMRRLWLRYNLYNLWHLRLWQPPEHLR